jgi:hypothetical protein
MRKLLLALAATAALTAPALAGPAPIGQVYPTLDPGYVGSVLPGIVHGYTPVNPLPNVDWSYGQALQMPQPGQPAGATSWTCSTGC